MGNIDYAEILKKSWAITRNNRFLWWFGLIIGMDGFLNLRLPERQEGLPDQEIFKDALPLWIEAHFQLFSLLLISVLVLLVLISLARIWASAGMIRSFYALDRGETAGFRKGMREGRDFFFPLLWLKLLSAAAILGSLVLVLTPLLSFFLKKSFGLGILSSLFGIPVLLILLISISFTTKFSALYIICSEVGLIDSIRSGYRLFIKNIGKSILMSVIQMAIGMFLGIILFLTISLLVLLPIFLAIAAIAGKVSTLAMIITALVIFLPASLFIGSLSAVFFGCAWFFFFKEVASPPKDGVPAVESQAIEETPLPEKA